MSGKVTSSLKCPHCDFTSKQSPRFVDHLKEHHDIPDDEVTQRRVYDEMFHGGVRPTCKCGCGAETMWNGWKKGYTSDYVRGHNARDFTIFSVPEVAKANTEKRVEGYRTGKYKVWNDGLTRETDERVERLTVKAQATLKEAYAEGKYTPWQLGLTKETDERLMKSSLTKKAKLESGESVPWIRGLTKETDERVARMAAAVSERFQKFGHHRRLSDEEILSRLNEFMQDKFILISDVSDFGNVCKKLEFECTTCHKRCFKNLGMIEKFPTCYFCHPKKSESQGQLEIFEFVKSICSDATISNKSAIWPKELDVFVPSRNFAVEYNGLYWHSEACDLSESYHSDKTRACLERGIRLMHVFEDEWKYRRPIVESMIRARLGASLHKLQARKLILRELGSDERKSFFDSCHIDGDVKSKVAWALVDSDNIIQVALSLRKPFHKSRSDSLEVARFCTRLDTSVAGGLSRLLFHASVWSRTNGYTSLISYVDTRLGLGEGYRQAGMKLASETGNRFWWTDHVYRYDRFKFRADGKRGLTEAQVADEAGVVKIWGCPNRLFELSLA